MRLKKILIGSGAGLLLSSPLIALAFVNAFPKEITNSSRFIIQPDSDQTKEIKEEVSKALDNTIGKDGKLELDYYTLYQTNQFTPSKLAWFTEVKKAMAWIDPRINFQLIPRSQKTVDSAYRAKNGQIITMWWSPDYHNLGTWLGFWFKSEYALPNMWDGLYEKIKSLEAAGELDKKENESFKQVKEVMSSENHGTIYSVAGNIPSFLKDPNNFHPNNPKAPKDAKPVVHGEVTNTFFQSTDALYWLDHLNWVHNKVETNFAGLTSDIMGYWFDTLSDMKYAVDIVSWMDGQAGMIPFFSQGPSSTTKSLVREGYHIPRNPFNSETYRDWFYTGADDTEAKPFRMWFSSDPFASNTTPYNASFNDSPNDIFFQSTYNGLVDWKINNDWEYKDGKWKAPDGSLTLGAATKITASPGKDGSGEVTFPSSGTPVTKDSSINDFIVHVPGQDWDDLTGATSYKFELDNRFNYMDTNGNVAGQVTAQDFFWGLAGYKLSCELGINKNDYFLGMMNINWDETVKANPDFYTLADNSLEESHKYKAFNLRPKLNKDKKEFIIKLNAPNINLLDILSKQYFQPLPIENQSVQEIFKGPSGALKYTVNDGKPKYDASKSDLNKLYGSGNKWENYKSQNWWSPGAYYIRNVTEQDMEFRINESYFNNFPKGMFNQDPRNNNTIKKISAKYGGSFSDQITYEQFKVDQLDRSKIPFSEYKNVVNNMKSSFRTEGVYSVERTDLMAFNTNVFIKDSNTGFYEEWTSKYPEDRKVVMPNGTTRVLKSLIPQNYYKAIVKDFFNPEGNSKAIRKGLINVIDWYSLAALAIPDDSPSFQNSVIPFGNFRWGPEKDGDPNPGIPGVDGSNEVTSYYELAQKQSNNYGIVRRTETKDGNVVREFTNPIPGHDPANKHWTFDSYIWWWEKQFRKQ